MLYHGSQNELQLGDKLTPQISFDKKPYVYATNDLCYAIIRSGRFEMNKFQIAESYDTVDCVYRLIELEPNAFKSVFGCTGYVYYLEDCNFLKTQNCANNEYISSSEVPIVGKLEVNKIYDYLKNKAELRNMELITYKSSEWHRHWEGVSGGLEGYILRRWNRLKEMQELQVKLEGK